MKILLLGASGRLGGELVSALNEDHELLLPPREGTLADDWEYCVDITNESKCYPSELQWYLKEHNPDCIVNCAGMSDVDECENDPEGCFSVNTWAVRDMARWCRKNDRRLVHISTNYVFNGTGSPYNSEDNASPFYNWYYVPVNTYGWSKLMAEWYIREIAPANHLIVRTANLFGGKGKVPCFAEKILLQARVACGPLHVTDEVMTNPTYVVHLANAIGAMIMDCECHTKHVVSEGCNYYEFARHILNVFGYGNLRIDPEYMDEYERREIGLAQRPSIVLTPDVELPHWEDGVGEWYQSSNPYPELPYTTEGGLQE